MSLFKLDEVIQMAMQAELAAQALYAALARHCPRVEVATLCRQLAAQEQAHYDTFKSIREAQPSALACKQLSLDEVEFVKGLVVERGVIPNEAEALATVRGNSVGAVLDLAVRSEQGSVVFYRELLGHIDASDVAEIREIIEEEKRHEELLVQIRRNVLD
jgi:rubrerythrin